MSRKTTIDEPRSSHSASSSNGSPTKAVFGNAADVVHDVAELAELQVKLLAADLNDVKRRLTKPIGLLVFVCLLTLASLPVLLMGLAEVFVQFADLSRTMSYFAAAGCGLALAGLLAGLAWWRLRNSFRSLENSRRELEQNIAWIKTTLKSGGQ